MCSDSGHTSPKPVKIIRKFEFIDINWKWNDQQCSFRVIFRVARAHWAHGVFDMLMPYRNHLICIAKQVASVHAWHDRFSYYAVCSIFTSVVCLTTNHQRSTTRPFPNYNTKCDCNCAHDMQMDSAFAIDFESDFQITHTVKNHISKSCTIVHTQ